MRIVPNTKLYDLFKLIVAFILLVILILLLLQRPAQPSSQPSTQTPAATATHPVSTKTPEPTATQEVLPFLLGAPEPLNIDLDARTLETSDGRLVYKFDDEREDWVPIIPDEIASTLDPDFVLRSEIGNRVHNWMIETQDGQLVYVWDMDTLTWKEAVSETAEEENASAPTVDIDCPLAKPSRLKAGDQGRVAAPLHIRSSPGIAANNLLFTMRPGTELEILGNPICLPHYKGAYLWWQVEIPGVQVGWSAEAPQNEDFYFIDPIE